MTEAPIGWKKTSGYHHPEMFYSEHEEDTYVSSQYEPGVVQHWQLHVNGRFVADSSIDVDVRVYEEIVRAVTHNPEYKAPERLSMPVQRGFPWDSLDHVR